MPPVNVKPADIRAWARANDIKVGTRGRLDKGLVALFIEAHA